VAYVGHPSLATVRAARAEDVERLREVERRAQARFEPYGLAELFSRHLVETAELAAAQRGGRLWVAVDPADQPVGFSLVVRLRHWVQLAEVDVVPEWGQRGLGAALVQRSIRWARDRGAAQMVLSTMRDVPWNAPFYRKLGFEIAPAEDLPPVLRALRAQEARWGLPIAKRVIMTLDLKRRS